MISSSQRPLPDNTRHSQQTNIHAPGGIRTQDLSRRAATGRSPAEIVLHIYIYIYIYDISTLRVNDLTFILLTWRKWLAPNNTGRQQMGFNSGFKELNPFVFKLSYIQYSYCLQNVIYNQTKKKDRNKQTSLFSVTLSPASSWVKWSKREQTHVSRSICFVTIIFLMSRTELFSKTLFVQPSATWWDCQPWKFPLNSDAIKLYVLKLHVVLIYRRNYRIFDKEPWRNSQSVSFNKTRHFSVHLLRDWTPLTQNDKSHICLSHVAFNHLTVFLIRTPQNILLQFFKLLYPKWIMF